MDKEEEQKTLKYFYNLRASIDESFMLFDEELNVKCGKEMMKQITLILNTIENLNNDNKQWKKYSDELNEEIIEKNNKIFDLENEIEKLQAELNKENNRCMILANNDKFKEQVINLMVKWISERCLYIDVYGNSSEIIRDRCDKKENCEQCIKEYFNNIVRGEN